jgi:hypothetical protein
MSHRYDVAPRDGLSLKSSFRGHEASRLTYALNQFGQYQLECAIVEKIIVVSIR